MDNQLKLLISLYDDEKARLEKLIDECLAEAEYLMAHYHSKALYQLNRRLQTLHHIDDKLYGKKTFAKEIIDSYQREIETNSSAYMREYYQEELRRATQELEILNQIIKPPTDPANETLLDEAIQNLVNKKITNLKLVLKKSDNLFLVFSSSKKVFKVTLPRVKQHTKKWILNDDSIHSLKRLGFNLTANGTKLVCALKGDNEDILIRLKIVLSKIVFEIFYFREFDNQSYIKFTKISPGSRDLHE